MWLVPIFFPLTLSFPLSLFGLVRFLFFIWPLMQWGFSCSFRQWTNFDLTIFRWNCAFFTNDNTGKSFCDVENGHRNECMRVARYAIASKWIAIQFSQYIHPTRMNCVYWCDVCFGLAYNRYMCHYFFAFFFFFTRFYLLLWRCCVHFCNTIITNVPYSNEATRKNIKSVLV